MLQIDIFPESVSNPRPRPYDPHDADPATLYPRPYDPAHDLTTLSTTLRPYDPIHDPTTLRPYDPTTLR